MDGRSIYKARFYQDNAGEWRWRVRAPNGKIVAASSEGYITKRASEDNFTTLLSLIALDDELVEDDVRTLEIPKSELINDEE